ESLLFSELRLVPRSGIVVTIYDDENRKTASLKDLSFKSLIAATFAQRKSPLFGIAVGSAQRNRRHDLRRRKPQNGKN
ncbi:MAG: hypothetical protein LUH59_07055, partial [Firmicutes bacterium]|nr:hypothetical protein [Bacillota bacterium]